MKAIMDKENKYISQTYARLPVAFEKGQGAKLYDFDGREYIDFSSGIGVNSVGYANEALNSEISKQLGKLTHASNLYYTKPCADLAEKLIKASSGMFKRVFFANSGAEANEGMIKAARKYSFDKYGKGRSKIITLTDSFHGRTITTLAATGQEHFHDYFFPFTEGFTYVKPGDMEAIEANAGGCCAIMLEAVQGEGGVVPLDKDFVKKVAEHCAKYDILLLFDEVQTGIFRTGRLFGFQHYGVRPDIISLAKGLGGGLPIGAVLFSEKTAGVLGAGDHGTTFGGNPLSCAAANAVMDIVCMPGFGKEVQRKGALIMSMLPDANDKVVEIRGKGLMIGIQLKEDVSAKDMVTALLCMGVVALTAGKNTLRLLPPLTIRDDELEAGINILKGVLEL